jgi:hypothetical protein
LDRVRERDAGFFFALEADTAKAPRHQACQLRPPGPLTA